VRALLQRVSEATVRIGEKERAHIGKGYVVFLGVHRDDTEADAEFLADKCSHLRVIEDSAGKMNLSLKDCDGAALVVSEFTLYGDASKGNRPNFSDAASPESANHLYEVFIERMRTNLGPEAVQTGEFRAMMSVTLVNDGPVTVLMESPIHNNS
jgi:D-tyrosyl-tRNA(Tyr) deacylase